MQATPAARREAVREEVLQSIPQWVRAPGPQTPCPVEQKVPRAIVTQDGHFRRPWDMGTGGEEGGDLGAGIALWTLLCILGLTVPHQ